MLRVHNGVTRVADVSPGCGQRNQPPQSCCCCCCCCSAGAAVAAARWSTTRVRRGPVVDLALVTATHPASVRGAFVTISAHIVVAHATPAVILVCTRRALSDQLYAILVKGDRKTAYHDGRRLSDQLPFVCSLADRLKSTMSNVGHFTPGTCPPNEMPSKFTAVRAILVHAAH